MARKIILNPDWPRAKSSPFAMATQVGDTIYVAGQVAMDPDGKIVGSGDMTAQSRQVFDNIETILALAGASMTDVVKITTYLTDMSGYADFSVVRAEVFPDAKIASATVASPVLVNPACLVEVETIAVIGAGG